MACDSLATRIFFTALCCLFASPVLALSFTAALERAWKSDPTFRGAQATHEAAKERQISPPQACFLSFGVRQYLLE